MRNFVVQIEKMDFYLTTSASTLPHFQITWIPMRIRHRVTGVLILKTYKWILNLQCSYETQGNTADSILAQ